MHGGCMPHCYTSPLDFLVTQALSHGDTSPPFFCEYRLLPRKPFALLSDSKLRSRDATNTFKVMARRKKQPNRFAAAEKATQAIDATVELDGDENEGSCREGKRR